MHTKPALLANLLFPAAVICFFAISLTYGSRTNSLLYGVLALVVVYYSARVRQPSRAWGSAFDVLGRASYALYLLSPVCLNVFQPKNTLEIIGFVVVISAISIITSQFVEEPLLKKVRIFLKKIVMG